MTEEQPKEKKKRSSKLPVEITEEEYTNMLRYTKSMHHKIAWMLMWESGLRVGEIIKIQPENIDQVNRTLRINGGKGDKDRITNLPVCFQPHHLNYFPYKCTKRAIQKAFEMYSEICGLKLTKPTVHCHSFRHGYTTHLFRNKAQVSNIQMMLGHTNIAITSGYNRMAPDEAIKEVNEIMERE